MRARGRRKHRERYTSKRERVFRDDYDRVWAYEAADEQARWDEAQDEALRERADAFDREHSVDVP